MNEQHRIVSVLLPVYNAGGYLKDSVMSILQQTYKSFELLILDDGSTDGCTAFLKDINDNRIRLIKRNHNYISTLNYGLSIARGQYIARMDADDKMFPTRLAEQVNVLNENPDVVICCSYMPAGSNVCVMMFLSVKVSKI
ncbi:MAG: glycosyltransferase family 2 protein [Bacteroidaceae bacterium]